MFYKCMYTPHDSHDDITVLIYYVHVYVYYKTEYRIKQKLLSLLIEKN